MGLNRLHWLRLAFSGTTPFEMDQDEKSQGLSSCMLDIPVTLVAGALIALLAAITATLWLFRQTTAKQTNRAKQTNDKEQDSPKPQSVDSSKSSHSESPRMKAEETEEAEDKEGTIDD
ncbi:hypothetical protein DPEC_G00026500 [Dallia pectoralis]|uniref:Uncharacterized protein n=1 Tax=Dallia pectoralis TaxID=75939 RepID=A0ACC2HHH9_DALPE|nr:hypothetical protein DPEC_G00026500 [Dallia pectoralis]